MNLLALNDFNLVAKYGGFARASKKTGRPKATLSRRVAELESSLELRLFERGNRILKLTQEGAALYERTSVLMLEIDETISEIASGGDKPRGRLRISAPLLFCQIAMGKLAAEFATKYPDVILDVTMEDRPVDMIEEGIDLVIRVDPKSDENLHGRMIIHDRLVFVSSQSMIKPNIKQPIPTVVRGFGEQRLEWELRNGEGVSTVRINPILSLSSMIMIRDAVRAGVGAGLLPISLVNHEIESGQLVNWGDVKGSEISLWVLYPSRRLLSARVSAFLTHLREAFPTGKPEELAAYVNS